MTIHYLESLNGELVKSVVVSNMPGSRTFKSLDELREFVKIVPEVKCITLLRSKETAFKWVVRIFTSDTERTWGTYDCFPEAVTQLRRAAGAHELLTLADSQKIMSWAHNVTVWSARHGMDVAYCTP